MAEESRPDAGPTASPIRVLVVDDHTLVREGTRQLLELEAGIEVVGVAGNGAEALRMVGETHPHVVLMDIEMPEMDGIEATARIAAEYPGTAVLVLSAYDDEQYVQRLIEAGALGYTLKDVRGGQLIESIRSVYRGESVLHPAIARKVMHSLSAPANRMQRANEALSDRELAVLRMAGRGLGNDAIALQLGISVRTVQAHFSNIFAKLDVESRTHAVVEALKRRLIRLNDLGA
ncbi:MAG: response regulator transcription factor [Dehalococcoidia bacterium]